MSPRQPSAWPQHVAVVGAGLAGLRTCAALRERGYSGTITVLGAERSLPYDRPPLSKDLLTRTGPAWLSDELGADVRDLAEEVRLGVRATELVRTARPLGSGPGWTIVVDAGSPVTADAVVLACGSEALNPWPEALTLHTAADAGRLRAALRPGTSLVIVGAGWIGAEVAGVAAGAGMDVTVVEAADQPLAAQLPRALGERTRDWYARAGVALRTGTAVETVENRLVTLADGNTMRADTVLAAVGVRPATAWLTGVLPLEPSGHVGTDPEGRTAARGVWAVGDCALRTDPVFGRVPGGHWSAALHDPDALAAAMLGSAEPGPRAAPFVYSTQLGHHLSVFGRIEGTTIPREYGDAWTALIVDGDQLTGAVIADAPRDVSAVRRLLGQGELPRLDLIAAADPDVRVRDLAEP